MYYVTVNPKFSGLDDGKSDTFAVTQTVYDARGRPSSKNIMDPLSQDAATAVVWAMNHPGALVTLLKRVRDLNHHIYNPLKEVASHD